MKLTIGWKFFLAVFAIMTLSLLVAGFLIHKTALTGSGVLFVTLSVSLGLTLLIGHLFAGRMARAVREIGWAMRQVGRGERLPQLRVSSNDEIADLVSAFNRMALDLETHLSGAVGDQVQMRAILSSMTEGVLVLDCRGTILLVNEALKRMFGLKAQKVVGRSSVEVLRHHALNELIKTILDTQTSQSKEITLQTFEARHFHVQASVTPNCRDGEICAVLVFHDITELKRLERVRKDFVANVSHELKTPLTSIKGYIEALLDGAKDDPKKCLEFLSVIQKHTDSLNSILSDLLQLSTIESGQYQWKREPVSIQDLIEKAVGFIRSAAEKKKQSLSIMTGKDLPNIPGDPDKLSVVLINLLDNAVKYTPEGGRVTVEATATPEAVEISVTDTGIGIPPKEIHRIFERFYSVDRARSRELGGTGLGLSIVKHIVEAHRGTVRVQSEPGKGSRFTVVFPLHSI